jgi:stage II sporulation protein D
MTCRITLFSSILLLFVFNCFAYGDYGFPALSGEPRVRIGLSTNAGSVSITTTDTQLVAASPDEPNKLLAVNKISVTARAYRPPEIEIYNFEIQNIENSAEAANLTTDIIQNTGEKAVASIDPVTGKWRVRVGEAQETLEEANVFKAEMIEKGFADLVIVTDKKVQPSDDALLLSQQLKTSGKSQVRSLIRATGSAMPVTPDAVSPNLREVIVSGASDTAKFTSLKAVSFGSINESAVPVRYNGKAYRGRIEVFVNSRGSLTVVNVVPIEDYLLGVVPSELGLPQLEAQKAQAVAARTYAIANINGFISQGFDLLPTISSQVYNGVSIETAMGTRAVRETRGIVATYKGKPITAYYTSTCGGRTENSENIFSHGEPYLRGVECSLEGHRQFDTFDIKTLRMPAKLRDETNLELVRLMSLFAVNGFQLSTSQMTDEWFESTPTESEMSNWLNNLAGRFGKTFPNVNRESAKPLELARILAGLIYTPGTADTLLSDADVNYQLMFDDAAEVPKDRRADVAMLLRDGYFAIHPDLTLKPNKPFSRAKMLRLIRQIYEKKKWMPMLQSGVAKPTVDGKLVLKIGKTEKQIPVRPDVFLFRQFGAELYPVKEAILVGGEIVRYQTDGSGAVNYLEIEPTDTPATAENMSPFTNWSKTMSPGEVRAKLSRYVRGLGSLIDVNIAAKGYSRRAIDLEIVTTNGTFHLKGGRIRSALRLNEQLFVINKRYGANGQVASYNFTGRGWGHGVGMCQYGAFGLAKMGVKYDAIIKHYYTGVDLTREY